MITVVGVDGSVRKHADVCSLHEAGVEVIDRLSVSSGIRKEILPVLGAYIKVNTCPTDIGQIKFLCVSPPAGGRPHTVKVGGKG